MIETRSFQIYSTDIYITILSTFAFFLRHTADYPFSSSSYKLVKKRLVLWSHDSIFIAEKGCRKWSSNDPCVARFGDILQPHFRCIWRTLQIHFIYSYITQTEQKVYRMIWLLLSAEIVNLYVTFICITQFMIMLLHLFLKTHFINMN